MGFFNYFFNFGILELFVNYFLILELLGLFFNYFLFLEFWNFWNYLEFRKLQNSEICWFALGVRLFARVA